MIKDGEFLFGYRCRVAKTFKERAIGLIGKAHIPKGEGLLITKCRAIHTFFMRFPIDAIFLDKELKPVKKVSNIKPWRPWIWGGFKAAHVLEIPS